MERYFQISLHGLIITAFMALAMTGRLDAASIILFTLGVTLSLYRAIKQRPPLLSANAVFYMSCVYILFFLLDAIHAFIPATIHLVLFLELAKLHQKSKNQKDYAYLVILTFLKVLAASSLTIDVTFVAALLLFLIALVSTLMSNNLRRFRELPPAEDRRVAASVAGLSIWAALCILVLASGLFFVIPRMDTGYFNQATAASVMLSGFSENVQLGEIGQVKLNSAVVMRARRVLGPHAAVLKWRGIALDTFDGTGWSRSDRARNLALRTADDQFSIHAREHTGELARYDIFLEPLGTAALFGPRRIVAVYGNFATLEVDHDESVYARFRPPRVEYQVLSEVVDPRVRPNALDTNEPAPAAIQSKYLQLPAKLDDRVRQLAIDITNRGSSVREKASLVEAHLKKNYRYTLDLTWKAGDQPVSTFLFEAKAGHCEYFASAMAILLRAAGIPTRIVNGFLMGEYNPVGDDFIIRQSDAHSWVEVYIPGSGWTEFDPTPPDPNQKEPGLTRQFAHYIDAMELFWNAYVLTYDTGSQMQLFRSAQERVEHFQEGVQNSSYGWGQRIQMISDRFARIASVVVERVWFWVGMLLAVCLALAYRHRLSLRTQWQIRKARNSAGPVDERVIEYLFYRAVQLAAGSATARKPGQTWREWTASLPDTQRRSTLWRTLDIFERAKYGGMQVTAGDFATLESAIRELRGRAQAL